MNDPTYPTTPKGKVSMSGTWPDGAVTGGITKLEYFTAMAMSGILSAIGNALPTDKAAILVAQAAIKMARATLENLEAEKGR